MTAEEIKEEIEKLEKKIESLKGKKLLMAKQELEFFKNLQKPIKFASAVGAFKYS